MHPDEIHSDASLVTRLIAAQAPDWADLPVLPVASTGTDNALYRLGTTLLVRMPRRLSAVALLEKELRWLPRLGGLPLAIPKPKFRGKPSDHYRHPFAVYSWIDGRLASPNHIADPDAAARKLGQFLYRLRQIPTAGAPPAGEANHQRGVPLIRLDHVTRYCIDAVADEIDADAARALWGEALAAPPHRGAPAWLHGDLKADNLLTDGGQLSGVIDWGLCATGDPAADDATAWVWVTPGSEDAFFDAANSDTAARARSRGWALYGAVIALSYYRGGKNEALCRTCRTTLARLGLR